MMDINRIPKNYHFLPQINTRIPNMRVGIVSLSENSAYVLNISYNLTIKKSAIDFNPILFNTNLKKISFLSNLVRPGKN